MLGKCNLGKVNDETVPAGNACSPVTRQCQSAGNFWTSLNSIYTLSRVYKLNQFTILAPLLEIGGIGW